MISTQPSIRRRVLAVALVPVAMVVVFLSAVFLLGRIGDIDEAHDLRVRSLVRQVASASEYGIFSANIDSLQQIAAGVLREPDVRSVQILDAHGTVLARAGESVGGGGRVPAVDRVVEPVQAAQVRFDDPFSDAARVGTQATLLGHVVLEISREALSERERDMLLIGVAVMLGGVLLGGFLALRLSRGVLLPIQRVSGLIDRIGHGDLAARAELLADDPLRELQKGLNHMAERLQQGRDELEQRVEAATRELRQKKEEAETATSAKSRFLAAASHDLRQPIHALGMFVTRLAQLSHDDETRRLVANLEASVQAMQNLLDALLDVSRLETGSITPQLKAVPLASIIEPLRAELEPQARDKGLSLRVRCRGDWVMSDPALLHRIVLNLATNALRYTRYGGVLVACRPAGDGSRVRIEVWDTGIGIAAEHRRDIFREFFQVGNAERDRRKGLGLGLSIVERTAALLGHPLTLCSVPGRGSRFSIEVPRTAMREQVETEPVAVQDDLTGMTVLVVEDDALSATALADLLASWGCSVRTAEGLHDALWHLKQGFRPDVLVSDYRLRQVDNGINVLRRLREACGRPVPAFLISGDTDARLMQLAREAGLTLLHKPVRPAKLRTLMRRLLQAPEA